MSKLIYSATKAKFETTFASQLAALPADNPIYRSIAFLEDGWLWTHGKFFKFYDAAQPFSVTLTSEVATLTNNTVTIKDNLGTEVAKFNLGIISVAGDAAVSATNTNGAISLTHVSALGTANTNTVGSNLDAINIPTISADAFGHVTGLTTVSTAVNQVKGNDALTSTYYLLGHASSTGGTNAVALKSSSVYVTNGTLHATSLSATLVKSLSIVLNGTTTTFNNSTDKSVSFYAPSTSGSTNTSTYLTPTSSGAPVWQTADSAPTSGSSNLITSGAVYTAVNAAVSTADAMVYKGILNATTSALPAANKGDTYKVSVAGTFNGTMNVEVGDMLICNTDGTTAVAYASIVAGSWTKWDVIQSNLVTSTAGLSLLNLTNPASTSLISVTSGGAASANYTLSGTGTVVALTNSPTFITPTLGAASATSINKVTITAPTTSATLTIANGKTLTANSSITLKGVDEKSLTLNNSLTFSGTDASTINFAGGGTVIYTNSKLNALASTSSSEFASVISDETGSGLLVFNTSPALTTPVITGTTQFKNAAANTDIIAISASSTASSSFTGTITNADLTAAQTWTLPNSTGTIALTNGTVALATDVAGGTEGALLYQSAANNTAFLNIGTSGKVLASTGTAPSWIDPDKLVATTSSGVVNAVATGTVYLNLVSNTTKRSSINITGSGATSVSSDATGTITISSINSWRNVSAYTISSPTSSTQILSTSIAAADLAFSSDFLWTSSNSDDNAGELKIGWAEIDAAGTITYAY